VPLACALDDETLYSKAPAGARPARCPLNKAGAGERPCRRPAGATFIGAQQLIKSETKAAPLRHIANRHRRSAPRFKAGFAGPEFFGPAVRQVKDSTGLPSI
jgi:hypothetical protein